MPQYKYLYNNGVPQVTFNPTGNVYGVDNRISWSNTSGNSMQCHYYLASVDLTGVSQVIFTCSGISNFASSVANAHLYIDGSEILLKDTENPTIPLPIGINVSTSGYKNVGFSFYGNSYNGGWA